MARRASQLRLRQNKRMDREFNIECGVHQHRYCLKIQN